MVLFICLKSHFEYTYSIATCNDIWNVWSFMGTLVPLWNFFPLSRYVLETRRRLYLDNKAPSSNLSTLRRTCRFVSVCWARRNCIIIFVVKCWFSNVRFSNQFIFFHPSALLRCVLSPSISEPIFLRVAAQFEVHRSWNFYRSINISKLYFQTKNFWWLKTRKNTQFLKTV